MTAPQTTPPNGRRIVGAAVLDDHLNIISLPPPARHHDCMAWARAIGNYKMVSPDRQGFITNRREYVDREQAMVIARAAKQLLPIAPTGPANILFSEDVW